jgi:hypothetical protein
VKAAVLALCATAACTGDLDPPWQLDHDRIVAVRATPPGVASGETAMIDALLSHKGDKTSIVTPELATVVSPTSLSDVLSLQAGQWVVTAPSEERLAAARTELKLAADAPVRLQIGVSFSNKTLFAVKVIELGSATTNPQLTGLLIDGKDPGSADLTVGKLVKVPLSLPVDDNLYDVTWLTSCGTMHDFDLPQAYLKVETDDPDVGQIGVVLRDAHGGVAWNMWSIRAQ